MTGVVRNRSRCHFHSGSTEVTRPQHGNEVFLAGAYAAALAFIGCGFEWMAAQREREAVDPPSRSIGGEREDGHRQDDPSFAHLGAAKFQRGLALVVCFCAIYILFVVALRHPAWSSVGLLCIAACGPGWVTCRIAKRFITSIFKRIG